MDDATITRFLRARKTDGPQREQNRLLLRAFAEFMRAEHRDRIAAGLTTARESGAKIGRPLATNPKSVWTARACGYSYAQIAAGLDIALSTVRRYARAMPPDFRLDSSEKFQIQRQFAASSVGPPRKTPEPKQDDSDESAKAGSEPEPSDFDVRWGDEELAQDIPESDDSDEEEKP